MSSVVENRVATMVDKEFFAADLATSEIIATSSVRYGILRIPPVLEIEGKIVTVPELLLVSGGDTITVVDKEYTLSTLWEHLIARIIVQLHIQESSTEAMLILPSWLGIDIWKKIQETFRLFGSFQVQSELRALAIAQAYNEAIPHSLALHVGIIEYLDNSITLTAARRKGNKWQTGKTIIENVKNSESYPRIVEWLFSAADSLFGNSEGLFLIDAPAIFIEQVVERVRLLNKLIRIEPVKRHFVVERALVRLAPELKSNLISANKSLARDSQQNTGEAYSLEEYPNYYSQIVASAGYADEEEPVDARGHTGAFLKVSLPLVIVLVIAAGIILALRNNRDSYGSGDGDYSRTQQIYEPTSSLVVSQSYTASIQGISFLVPSGWTKSSDGKNERSGNVHEVDLFHSIRPWEIIKIVVANHPFTQEQIRKEIAKHPSTIRNFLYSGLQGKWHHYSYDIYPEGISNTRITRIKNDVLVGSTMTLSLKCVLSDSNVQIPECSEVLHSILSNQ